MDAVLIKLLEQLNSSVFVLLLVLIVMFWFTHKTGKWTEMFNTHKDKINKAEENHDKFSHVVMELKTKMDLVYQNTNPNRLTQAQSPISITATGQNVSDEIDAPRILQENILNLVCQVNDKSPKNAYDIQMVSMQVVKEKIVDLLSEHDLNKIKQVAFERGLLIEDIMTIFGVLLRNHILEELNIPIAAVDKHTPQS